jgi:hypothetical protein
MIDSFNELPKEHRPPKSIWDKPSEIEEWFDRIYKHEPTELNLNLPDESQIEV